MRKATLITILTVGAAVAILSASSTAEAQYQQCIKGRGCVPTSQRSYNACFNLALARGESAAWANAAASTGSSINASPGRSRSMGIAALKHDDPVAGSDADPARALVSHRIVRGCRLDAHYVM
jgi:hypothetical protein